MVYLSISDKLALQPLIWTSILCFDRGDVKHALHECPHSPSPIFPRRNLFSLLSRSMGRLMIWRLTQI